MSEWQSIDTAPKDGREILVLRVIASVPVVRNASWSDGELWEMQGEASQADARGWWAPVHSVTQEKLEGLHEPTHWAPMPDLPAQPVPSRCAGSGHDLARDDRN